MSYQINNLSHALTDKEINDFFNGKVNILKYSELKNKSLKEILGKFKRCIILYEQEYNKGHWVLLHEVKLKNKKPYLEYFDSYGLIPTKELDWIPKSMKYLTNQQKETLLNLLLNQPLQVRYSQYRLQKLGKLHGFNVNNCGKWCCIRAYYNKINEDEFDKLMRSENIEPDLLCCMIYDNLLNR